MPSTLPTTRDEFEALLRREEVPQEIVRALMAHARPALQLDLLPQPEASIPVGASKFGGAPDLPPGFTWPHRDAYANGEAWAAKERGQAGLIIPLTK